MTMTLFTDEWSPARRISTYPRDLPIGHGVFIDIRFRGVLADE